MKKPCGWCGGFGLASGTCPKCGRKRRVRRARKPDGRCTKVYGHLGRHRYDGNPANGFPMRCVKFKGQPMPPLIHMETVDEYRARKYGVKQ